jgi:predicted metalloprotease
MAYVVAHEVGHHIQNVLGTSDKVSQMRGRVSEKEYNQLSVRLELQADFLAGVWAHHAEKMKKILEEGDIEEALGAANAIGDDKLQKESQGYVVPDAFTHGTSAQRVKWFKRGFDTGDINQGDTFSDSDL